MSGAAGQLVAGIAGAAIGFVAGGPVGAQIGWIAATTAFSLLNPPKVTGPRRSDLKLQRSEYGAGIPWIRGTVRSAGIVIDQTDLVEHETSSGGKGGGGGTTTYTYSASFAILLCEGPIVGIRRIWADGRVIWSGGEATADVPFKLYLGDSTQDPDPTLEAMNGTGAVPDFRGYAYIVFTDMMLTDYGDRIPNLEFEIDVTGAPRLTRYSTFYPTEGGNGFTNMPGSPFDGAYIDGGQLVVCHYEQDSPKSHYTEFRHNLKTGEIEETTPTLDVDNVSDSSAPTYIIGTNSNIAYGLKRLVAGPGLSRWYIAGERQNDVVEAPAGTGIPDHQSVAARPLVAGDYVYAPSGGSTGSETIISRWAFLNDSHTALSGTAEDDFYDLLAGQTGDSDVPPAGVSLALGDDGYLYALYPTEHSSIPGADLVRIDRDTMSAVKVWEIAEAEVQDLAGQSAWGTFTVYRGYLIVSDISASPALANMWTIPENTSDPFVKVSADDVTHEDFGSGQAPLLNLGGGYVLGYDGIFYIDGLDTVGACCQAITQYGDGPTDSDTSDLPDKLRGFRIAEPMTKLNAIEELRHAFFFGIAEIDDVIVFRHTYHDADEEIPEGDLGAYPEGSDPPPAISWECTNDDELPRKLTVKFIDADSDYAAGAAVATRDSGASTAETSLELAIVFTYQEAKAIAEAHMMREDVERWKATFTVPRKWLTLAPLDIVTVGEHQFRVADWRWTLGEPIEVSAMLSRAAVFDGLSVLGSASSGGVGGGSNGGGTTTRRTLAPTESVLMDIPIGSGPLYGFGWAAGPKNGGRWPGAVLFKSYDGGTNYEEVARKTVPDVIGRALDALDDYTDPITDPDATGTVQVRLTRDDAELVTITDSALDGGANRCAIESGGTWEILQFRDATLDSPQTYTVDYLLRGQSGTEDAIDDHAIGDSFVAMPVQIVDAPESDLDQAIWYQAVTIGASISPTGWVQFTNTGQNTNSQGGGAVRHLPALFKFHNDDYTFVEADRGYWHIFEGSSTIAVTLPAGLKDGWNAKVINIGANDVTLDPVNNLDGDSASLVLEQFQGIEIATDGTDYYDVRGKSSGGGGGGSSITVKDQGSTLTTALASLDFLGASITAAHLGAGAVSVTVVQTIHTLDGGVTVDADADTINANAPLSMSDAGGGVTNLTHDASGVSAGSYGSASSVPVLTIDATGHVTAASTATVGSPAVSTYIFGDGADGAAVFDGSTAVAGFTRSGSVYTQQRPVAFTNVTHSSGVTIRPNNCGPIYVNGTYTGTDLTSIVEANGTSSTGTAGGAGIAANFWGATASGGAAGGGGSSAVSNSLGSPGGQGGASSGGTGGLPAGGYGTPGACTVPTPAEGGLAYAASLQAAMTGRGTGGTRFNSGSGGGGGQGGTAGGGGAAAGYIALFVKNMAGVVLVRAIGGDGRTPGANQGAGGSGSGGIIWIVTQTPSPQTVWTFDVSPGTPGTGSGTGCNGLPGSSGHVYEFVL